MTRLMTGVRGSFVHVHAHVHVAIAYWKTVVSWAVLVCAVADLGPYFFNFFNS